MVELRKKSYLGPAKISSFSSRNFSRSNNMTHSDMLYRLDISTFYFYEQLLFQIFVLWKFIKTKAFPCLLSHLQSTATQITITINIFVSNIIEYEISFFIKIHVKDLTMAFYIQI